MLDFWETFGIGVLFFFLVLYPVVKIGEALVGWIVANIELRAERAKYELALMRKARAATAERTNATR